MDAAGILGLVLAHDLSIADELYSVCQSLTAAVVQHCSRVTCPSLADVTALLHSPRWSTSKQCTALHIFKSKAYPPLDEYPTPQPGSFCIWAKTAAVSTAELKMLAHIGASCPHIQQLVLANLHDSENVQAFEKEEDEEEDEMIGPAAAAAVTAAAPHWPLMQDFSLSHMNIGNEGAAAVASAITHWPRLQNLDLAGNEIGLEGVVALVAVAGPGCQELSNLALSSNGMHGNSMKVLADAGRHWKKLKHINMWNNQLDLGGVQSWAAVAHDWQGLEVVILAANSFDNDNVAPLAAAACH